MRSLLRRLTKWIALPALLLAVQVAWAGSVPGRLIPSALAMGTFIVNSTGDEGDSNTADGVCNDGAGNCTLRAAIQQANATAGADAIHFNIPGAGVRAIAPMTALPTISDAVTIDGYTQPGASPNTLADGNDAVLLIELSGINLSIGAVGINGLSLGSAGGCVIRGLVINRFGSGSGISVATGEGSVIEGNFIGTDTAGAARAGNLTGVTLNVTFNVGHVVGGATPAARNVISGNGSDGVIIQQGGGSQQPGVGARVIGNFIGTDASGRARVMNGGDGVDVRTTRHTIGGTTAAERNVISGNSQAGVMIQPGTTSSGSVVQGNYIGTDVTGTHPVGNFFGVWVNFGAQNNIGGPAATAGNLISGNTASGVLLSGDSRNNQIGGNFIGTDATGTRALGNGRHGIEITESATGNFVQQQGASALPNTIAFNAENGVAVFAFSPFALFPNTISRNNIFSNGQLGIDLGGGGVTPNDAGDGDIGPNGLQNFPIITSVTPNGSTTNVQGTLNSKPSTSFGIDFFTNSSCDPSGHGEGARFIFAAGGIVTDANGNATFSLNLPVSLPGGRVVTATVTESAAGSRNTSEFSPCNAAGASGSVEFSAATYNVIEDVGAAAIRLTRTGGSAGTLTVNFATDSGTATPGADYTSVSTAVTFADGETAKTVAVPIVNDGATEPDEAVGLILFNTTDPDAVGARGRATLNIIDSSKRPSVSISDATVAEGLSGTTNAVFNVTLSAATGQTVAVNFQTTDGTATSPADYSGTSGMVSFAPGDTTITTIAVPVNGDTLDEPAENFFVNLTSATGATIGDGQGIGTITNNRTPVLQFSAGAFSANEGDHVVNITVTRSGQTAGSLTIDYATAPGTASERKDYTTALGTLRFAPGEASKTFTVLLTDDGFQEGDETINLALSNPTGGAALVGQSTATLTVADNDMAPSATNPIDASQFFVRQHYHDFLNREPDLSGLNFWTNEIESCGADAQCREVKRINVSAAFFLSIEFQETGYFVYRTHKTAFGNLPNRPLPIRLREFLAGTQEIGRGVEVGVGDWQARLENNKQTFVNAFVTQPEFSTRYPQSMTAAQFVDGLNANAGGALSVGERDQLVADLSTGAKTRAQVLRAVAEDQTLKDAEINRAFVLAQYFGYLRRNPDDAPDANFEGFNFWLAKLNQFNGNFVQAEMVRAFIESIEYRERFR